MWSAFADYLRHVFLCPIEIVHQREIAACLLARIEIRTLYIFDNGIFERLRVICFHHSDRHVMQARTLRGAPSPLSGDDLEVIALECAHHDRLNDATLTN